MMNLDALRFRDIKDEGNWRRALYRRPEYRNPRWISFNISWCWMYTPRAEGPRGAIAERAYARGLTTPRQG